MVDVSEDTMFYFGVYNRGEYGHFLHVPCGKIARDVILPFSKSILDGGLIDWSSNSANGRAVVNHINGWTILSFPDRSGDGRPMSNSNFLCRGHWDFKAMITDAKTNFPTLFERFNFEIVDIEQEKVDEIESRIRWRES